MTVINGRRIMTYVAISDDFCIASPGRGFHNFHASSRLTTKLRAIATVTVLTHPNHFPMKSFPLFKLALASALLILAAALSCTDHNEPDPQTGCTLVSGAPRLYPCEFEIQKVEFCNKLDVNDVFGTITPGSPDITLPLAMAWNSFHPTPGTVDATFKVKIHIKRVSMPSFDSSNEYIMPKVTGVLPVSPQTFDISHFPPLFPPVPVRLDMQLNQTTVVFADAFYHATEQSQGSGGLLYTNISGTVLYLIYNMATAAVLAGPPNNYPTILDVGEAHIAVNPTLVQ